MAGMYQPPHFKSNDREIAARLIHPNIVTAYDATNGKVLWRFDPQVPTKFGRMACCDIVSRGLAVTLLPLRY